MRRSYERSVFWSRLLLCAFFSVTAAFLIWTIPWLPFGTSAADYHGRVALQTLLGFGAGACALGAVYLRDKTRQKEAALLTWTSVHDSLIDLRRREYFFNRLLVECDKAHDDGHVFAVVVLRLQPEPGTPPELRRIHAALEALEPLSAEYDWLAAIGAVEVAMLAPGIREDTLDTFVGRLKDRVDEALRDDDKVTVIPGWALYGPEASGASDLISRARQMLPRTEAAAA